MLDRKQLLLVIAGGIAAYKCLDLIRRLGERGASVRCVLTDAARQFITPLSLSALSQDKVYTDLFSLTDENEMGHIRLAREADLVVVAPATADILARMRGGFANDLASAVLLATDKPVLVAPAMNTQMWRHPATRENIAILQQRGVAVVGPNEGTLACHETGAGRMAEALEIVAAIETCLTPRRLAGLQALVTSGPTHEPIDPVRYIANRSSGKQGHAIAAALSRFGAKTMLISGPVQLPDPPGVQVAAVETAEQMLAAVQRALPVDIAVCAAAVADWRVVQTAAGKVKKAPDSPPPALTLMENPDILASLALDKNRPTLLIGFAAETDHVVAHAQAKRQRKGIDWILANDVGGERAVFGDDRNTVHLVSAEGIEDWPTLTKIELADRLVKRIAQRFER